MPDFTSVFSQERDHWRSRAEAAEAELERERARAREHLDARCRAEGRSEAWQMNADGWRQRATRAEAEVERLRGALEAVEARNLRQADTIDRARFSLGEAWDDGNACGLDGWVGPGRGAGEVDDEAVRARDRCIDKLLRGDQ